MQRQHCTHFGSLKCLVALALSAVLSACGKAPPAPPPPLENTSAFVRHTIREGESLAVIALWYTGDETAWRQYYMRVVERSVRGRRPHEIIPGDEVLIPLALTHTTQPPTSKFLAQYHKIRRPRGVPDQRKQPAQIEAQPAEAQVAAPVVVEPSGTPTVEDQPAAQFDPEREFLEHIIHK